MDNQIDQSAPSWANLPSIELEIDEETGLIIPEVWRQVLNYEKYFVSNYARVYSEKVNRLLLFGDDYRRGYLTVAFYQDKKGKTFKLHKVVMDAFHGEMSGVDIDHKNEIKTDCRLRNLRRVTARQNNHFYRELNPGKKTSKFVGVSFAKDRNKWRARIYVNGKTIRLGSFDDESSAHDAYLNALKTVCI